MLQTGPCMNNRNLEKLSKITREQLWPLIRGTCSYRTHPKVTVTSETKKKQVLKPVAAYAALHQKNGKSAATPAEHNCKTGHCIGQCSWQSDNRGRSKFYFTTRFPDYFQGWFWRLDWNWDFHHKKNRFFPINNARLKTKTAIKITV